VLDFVLRDGKVPIAVVMRAEALSRKEGHVARSHLAALVIPLPAISAMPR